MEVKDLLEQLSPESYRELIAYIEYLLHKQERKKRRLPRFRWAGALQNLREKYTSVELQHEIAHWRGQ